MYTLKKIIYYIISLFFSLIITILFLELYVRLIVDDGFNYELEMMKYANTIKKTKIINDQKVFLHKPNFEATIMRAKIKIDQNGYRYKYNVNDNDKIIMLLGDSMTFGFGSNFTFADYLQESFGNNYKIMNTGVGNTNTIMQEKSFFKYHKIHNPKILILNFFINDLEIIEAQEKSFIKRYFYSFSYISYKYKIIELKLKKNLSFKKYYKKTFQNKENLEKVFLSIQKLQQYSDENDIKFFVHFIPELHDLKNYPFINEHNIIKNFLIKKNIKFIDGVNYLKNSNENNLLVSIEDAHANETAHKLMGEYLLKFIYQEIL